MMKKIILGIAALSLAGASVMYMSSCAIKQGPVSPNTNLVSSTDSRSNDFLTVTGFSVGSPLSLTGEIRITFNKKTNPNTLNTGTVLIYYKNGSDTSELQYTEFSITYVDALKTMILRPTNVAGWRDNTRYRIQLMHGIMTAAGAPLDGNANDINDGNVLDDYHNQFYTGAPPAGESFYSLNNLTLSSVLVQADIGGANSYNVSSLNNHGNVPASYTYVTITATFSNNLDPSTAAAITAIAGGAAPSVISSTVTTNQLVIVLQLTPATKYMLTMLGGITGIRSSSDVTEVLNRGKYFARGGTSNSKIEAADKHEVYLSTAAADNTDIVYPDVTSAFSSGLRRFRLDFGATQMNAATLTNANIMLAGKYPNNSTGKIYNIVPKLIDIQAGELIVDVYLPDRFYPAVYGSTPTTQVRVIVKRTVQSAAGQYLDANGDGIVLTDDDDFVSNYESVSSGI